MTDPFFLRKDFFQKKRPEGYSGRLLLFFKDLELGPPVLLPPLFR